MFLHGTIDLFDDINVERVHHAGKALIEPVVVPMRNFLRDLINETILLVVINLNQALLDEELPGLFDAYPIYHFNGGCFLPEKEGLEGVAHGLKVPCLHWVEHIPDLEGLLP